MWMRAIASFIIALFMMVPANAFELVIDETIIISGDPTVYYIDGKITKRTWERFAVRVAINRPITKVVLNSGGGYVVYAIEIAKMIRALGLTTEVQDKKACFSACVLIFQSGSKRIAHKNAVFMLHPVTIEVAGVNVPDKWSTNNYFAWLVFYGMNFLSTPPIKRDRDVYFNAETALQYRIATEVVEK